VWNKTRKRDQWGVKHQQPRPKRDWLRVDVPGLAIVDEALWAAAHAAMSQQRTRFGRDRRFRSPGRLSGGDGVDTRYLLTGLLQCSHTAVAAWKSGRAPTGRTGCHSSDAPRFIDAGTGSAPRT
jgi:hypothetical protein